MEPYVDVAWRNLLDGFRPVGTWVFDWELADLRLLVLVFLKPHDVGSLRRL